MFATTLNTSTMYIHEQEATFGVAKEKDSQSIELFIKQGELNPEALHDAEQGSVNQFFVDEYGSIMYEDIWNEIKTATL